MGDRRPALLFDFNGVIVDDEEQHRLSFGAVLAEAGIALTREQYYADYLGFDDHACFVAAFARAGVPLSRARARALVAEKARRYAELTAASLPLVPGVAPFVERAAQEFRLGLVSGALRREVARGLERAALTHYFGVVVAAEDVPACKPDPAGYLAARAALAGRGSLDTARCVVIEDALPGLAAARAAGMRCAMLATSYPPAALEGADLVWRSFVGHDPGELGVLLS